MLKNNYEIKTNIMNKENPTKGQLIYLRDLSNEEELVEYMACRWEYKFNKGSLTEKDLKKFHEECNILKVNSFTVCANMNDWGLI